ncbi:MAG: type II toxin-antitoxin system RatA family toxin [Dehalococcoidia bacterium]
MGVIKLSPQCVSIKAHRELVYQMVTAIGRGRLPGSNMSSRLISRNGNTLIAEFYTRVGPVTVTTLEELTLEPPEKIKYRWLKGPVKYVREEFLFREADNGGSELAYSGEFDLKIPIFGWLVGRLFIKPRFERLVVEHMEEIREAAEARAARSHLYPRPM